MKVAFIEVHENSFKKGKLIYIPVGSIIGIQPLEQSSGIINSVVRYTGGDKDVPINIYESPKEIMRLMEEATSIVSINTDEAFKKLDDRMAILEQLILKESSND